MEEEFEQWFEDTFGEFAKNSEKRFCYVGYKHSIFKKDKELAALRDLDELKSLILRMDKVKEEYGCGFYNQKDWYDDYKLIVEIAKGE